MYVTPWGLFLPQGPWSSQGLLCWSVSVKGPRLNRIWREVPEEGEVDGGWVGQGGDLPRALETSVVRYGVLRGFGSEYRTWGSVHQDVGMEDRVCYNQLPGMTPVYAPVVDHDPLPP